MGKPTTKTKPMTLEGFAAAIQQDFLAIRRDMATKADIRAIRDEMATKEDVRKIRDEMATKEDIRKIRDEMATKEKLDHVSDRISVAKDELQEQIAGLRYAKEIDALAGRLKLVEAKLGLRPTRHAA